MRVLHAVVAAWVLAACTTAPLEGPEPRIPSTPTRPQLDAASAARYAIGPVLARGGRGRAPVHDGWNPLADRTIQADRPPALHYRVDPVQADGRTRFATVQAAVNRAHHDVLAGVHAAAPRVTIGIAPGRYVETLIVPATPKPITLWGLGTAPQAVRIEYALSAGTPRERYEAEVGPVYEAAGMHADITAIHRRCIGSAPQIGTNCSAVVSVSNDGFQARNVTVANAYDPAEDRRRSGRSHQAVAFKSEGADRVHLEQVHLTGWQDTLYLKSRGGDHIARSFVHRSLVEGDVDFIFGAGTAYFLESELRWVGHRRGLAGGWVAAPSTSVHVPYGLVFERCRFTADPAPGAPAGTVALARQWFVGARCSPYRERGAECRIDITNSRSDANTLPLASLEAVGKMVVLRSDLGAHLDHGAPWAPWQADPRSPAYRPAQFNRGDFVQRLADAGVDTAPIGGAGQNPPEPFLAEYLNRQPPTR